MFVALDTRTNAKIISLDPRRSEAELREGGRAGVLVCPECRQLFVFREGTKRRHFAHKQLGNCPFEHEHPELVEARAVLYEWLVYRFPDRVQIEHRPHNGNALPRPIDLVVTLADGTAAGAFWIFDAAIRSLDVRQTIADYFANSQTPVTWVFVSTMLRPDPPHENAIILSKMERDLLVRTEYDESKPNSLGSIHYLSTQERRMLTYRGLVLRHRPNVYGGRLYSTDLASLLAGETGSIVHPGEDDLLKEFRAAEERERARDREPPTIDRLGSGQHYQPAFVRWMPRQHETGARVATETRANEPAERDLWRGKCKDCGEMKTTADSAEYQRSKNECVCKACMRRRGQR